MAGFSTREDRAEEIREQLADLRRDYEEECEYIWRTQYESDALALEAMLDDVLGIVSKNYKKILTL